MDLNTSSTAESEAAKWNLAIVCFINYTCADCQSITSVEKVSIICVNKYAISAFHNVLAGGG